MTTTRTGPARTTRRIRARRSGVACLLVAVAAVLVVAIGRPSSPAPAPTAGATVRDAATPVVARPADVPRAGDGPLGEADGAIPGRTTVFDDGVPGVANLDPSLLDALRRAAADAADVGVVFLVDSGWRSPAYQERLRREAVATYGSEGEAARWVATPETSAHVSGDAVDVGPASTTSWMAENGARYGLCQIYANEPWHYELRPDAVVAGCPAMYADPTHDPRMRR